MVKINCSFNYPVFTMLSVLCWLFLLFLMVDLYGQTFTRITSGAIVNDGGGSVGSSWGDFDNDGDLDLFVANDGGNGPTQNNFLYQNNGDGTFIKITSGDIVNDGGRSRGSSWGDYDNDGDLDLFVANGGHSSSEINFLYENNSDGTFTKITTGDIVNDVNDSHAASWGDYDNDGDLDLFVVNWDNQNNNLYANNGDGTFTKITTGIIVNDGGTSQSCNWIDFDNDGDLDLFVGNEGQINFLYANNGDGTFTKITRGSIVNDYSSAQGSCWGDFNKDGYVDLFVTNCCDQNNSFYKNNGDRTFTKITVGDIVNDGGDSQGSNWGDFDNDGDLDLFVSNHSNQNNFLYANNDDGTFTKITTYDIVNDSGDSWGLSWGDVDNDGDLDLFVPNQNGQNNFLYLNNGNSNHWINIKCVGSISNTSAIGAKVKVKAIINGAEVYQMNEISALTGGGFGGQNSLNAEFGLGDATVVEILQIEWPSGITQILNDVPADQFLTITEPAITLSVSPRAIDFGQVLTGDTATDTVIITNIGTVSLDIQTINFTGFDIDNFTVETTPFTLAPDESNILEVSFTPDADHRFRASLNLMLGEAGVNVNLAGTGILATFTKITTGAISTEGGSSNGCSWGDFDNDGDLDLFVPNSSNNFLYSNNGNGTFGKVTSGRIVTDAGTSLSATWGDYDNDGDPDLFVPNWLDNNNFLYANNGDGTFNRITTGIIVNDGGDSWGASWGDFDNDSDLDLFVANGGFTSSTTNFLYTNNGDGTFTKITTGDIVTDAGSFFSGSWGDYDDDGDLDLLVSGQPHFLYQNNGDGSFTKITVEQFLNYSSRSASWGDYDNDRDLDIFLASGSNYLFYQNKGNGIFSEPFRITNEGNSISTSWGDYDNDGDLDLFVTNDINVEAGFPVGKNSLYTNLGDGTFLKLTGGEIANDRGISNGCSWADYDNDGDLDIFVANNDRSNDLYQNNGNSNHWINIKCIGTVSNTSAIGTRVRAKATIKAKPVWQLQEISAQTGSRGQNSLNVEFGMDDATVIDSLIVEWPASKTVQVFTNIAVDQFLTISETDLLPAAPRDLQAEPADQQATLNWNLNTEIDFLRYRIYGGTAPNPTTVVDSVDGLPNATKTISGLSNGTTYFFRITALDASLQESSFSNEINVTPFALGRITSGEIPADAGNSTSASWPDFDNDDDLDLFVTNQNQKNFLYSNNGDGSFSKITSGALVDFAANHLSSTWGDFDNDGDLDVFIANGEGQNNFLFENRSDASFTRISTGAIVNDGGNSFGAVWGDFDNDRNLDLFVANKGEDNFLYRNNGDGTFSKITADPVVTDGANSTHGSWADFDLDNDLDLFVTNDSNQDNFFYRNNGDGTFTKVINDVIVTDGGESMGSSWGDFDGDNVLDLFVANRNNQNNFLYRNNGDGTFTKITTGTVVKEGGSSLGSAWADFDNDGDLDLSVTNEDGTNFLYTNRGDGTFTKITTGAVVNDFGRSHGAAWSDFDRDGDLDLFVANSNNENNFLYSNSLAPEGNRWLNIKCVGTASNTSAIGAKVQVKATVFGQPKWQLREISAQSGGGSGGQNLHAAYGLGDAAVVDTIKIEWPSGIVDILTNIEPNQFLTISEAVANRAPIANVAFSDTTLIVGAPALSRDLEAEPTVFSDEDGDPLTYRAGSSNSSVATAGVSGSVLTVTAQAPGTATITVTANDGKGGSGSLMFNVTVEANLPPVVDHTPPTVQESGQVINLTVNASDDLDIANVFLNYRQGGGIAFTTAGMLRSDNTFNGTIPASFVDSRGVEYFISATDLAGVQTRVPTNSIFSVQVHVSDPGAVKGTAQPGGSEQIAYRLISVPIDLENKNPRAIFEDDLGPFDIFKWRFFEIRADQNRVEFPNTSNMTQGKAFWLIVKEPDQVIDTGAGTSNSTLQEFAITLHPQWNTIGNPFNFSIPLSNMRLASGEIPEFRFFTGSWNDPVNAPVTVVQPFEGYAIFNNSTSTDTLFVDPDLSASARVSRKEALRAVTKTVSAIHIRAQSQQARDIDNIAGITANAAIAWDRQDRPEPPVIGEYVSVYFPHPEWKMLSENYCTDFRPESSDGEVWEFEVKTNIRDVVHLTFQPSNSLEPSEGSMPEMWLLDEALNISQNLRERNSYSVASSESHPKRLKLVVGKPDFVEQQLAAIQRIPSTFELSQNFPNPFNPTTTIRYGLPAPGRVTLKIYNVLGEEVLTLVDDVPRQAGYHAAVWDGRNESSQRVASGLYFYQLQMDEIVLTKKMALVR